MQKSIKEECEPDRGQNELQVSLPQKEQPEICSAMILTAVAHSELLQCSEDTNNQIPVSSSVCDLMYADGTVGQTKDPNTSAIVETNYHKVPESTMGSRQYKNRSSPLLTFRRRAKKKINLDEPTEEICSPENEKQHSTLTCSQPSSSINDKPLLKYTAGDPLDTEDKVFVYPYLTLDLYNDAKWHVFFIFPSRFLPYFSCLYVGGCGCELAIKRRKLVLF
jgi:hypothetical protein